MRRLIAILAATASLGASSPALADAGVVEFASGVASLRDVAGKLRPAVRTQSIAEGETAETEEGRLHLRMRDGAMIALQPRTTLRIDAYTAPGTPAAEEKGWLALVRGGMRTITGLIGSVNRDAYRLQVPTATIGIRGTEFAVRVDEGARVTVAAGRVALCNDAGCVEVGAGQTGVSRSTQSKPTLAFEAARLPPQAADEPAPLLQAETRTSTGVSTAIGSAAATPVVTPMTSGAGGSAIAAVDTGGSFAAGLLGGSNTFGAAPGPLTAFTDCCTVANNYSGGTVTDVGNDGIIAWGRWTGGVRNATPLAAMNYVSNLTANNVTASSIIRGYTAFGSTAPVVTSGGSIVATGAANSVTGSLTVSFANLTGGGSLSYTLNIPVLAQTFTVSGTASQFSGAGFLGSSSTITSTGAGCIPSGCAGNIPFGDAIQGFFTGPAAERAGANYGFTTSSGQLSGAVVFK